MSIEAKAQYLGRIYDRYQRAGRQHKSKILDEFCEVCGYHRKAALRLLNRPRARPPKPPPTTTTSGPSEFVGISIVRSR